jgi:hypothetical protein
MSHRWLRVFHALLRVWLGLLLLALAASPAWASCSMTTITWPNGRVESCMTCCVPGLCQTQCQ